MMQFFSQELLPYFHIEREVDHIGPTELVYLELKKLCEYFNLVMKNGAPFELVRKSINNISDKKIHEIYDIVMDGRMQGFVIGNTHNCAFSEVSLS